MSDHRVTVAWDRTTEDFTYESYSRNHTWTFEGGVEVPASAAPAFRGDPSRVDPEAAFVAALSSCHMLTFLAIAARKRLVVDGYRDDAVGHLEKDEAGKLAMTRVILRPRVAFREPPSPEVVERMHHTAHQECFIASVSGLDDAVITFEQAVSVMANLFVIVNDEHPFATQQKMLFGLFVRRYCFKRRHLLTNLLDRSLDVA